MGNPVSGDIPRTTCTTPKSYIEDMLSVHNELRAKHSSPPMTISDQLCEIAQSWANHCAEKGRMEHMDFDDISENIYMNTAEPTARAAAEKWYSEIKDFNWGKINERQKGTGHFTQLVWAESNELGVAKASGKSGNFVVAVYAPGGNCDGEFEDNVKPL